MLSLDRLATSGELQPLSPIALKSLSALIKLSRTIGSSTVRVESNTRLAAEAGIHRLSSRKALAQLHAAGLVEYINEGADGSLRVRLSNRESR